jgi:hypothetical protein
VNMLRKSPIVSMGQKPPARGLGAIESRLGIVLEALFDRASKAVTVAPRLVARAPEWRTIIVCGVVIVIANAVIVSMRHLQLAREHLGGENGNIALALVNGRGFSDAFAQYTGPTAWMPPFLPMLLAALYKICRTQRLVAWSFWALSMVLLSVSGGILHRIARERAQVLPARLVVFMYLVWVCLFHFYFVVLTHDVAVITFLLSLIIWQVHRATRGAELRPLRWGMLGALSLLTSPATAAVWGLTSVALARLRLWNWRRVVTALAISVALGMPWIARNAAVFHQFIPVKSNLFCDLAVANYVDDDGIWDRHSMYIHPYLSLEERTRYTQLGEMGYTSLCKRMFLSELSADPQRYLGNVLRRALAVTVRYVPSYAEADENTERSLKRIVLPLFFLPALLGQFVRGPNRNAARMIGAVWLIFMLPYVAIGLHIRHVLPISVALILMAFFGADSVAERLRTLARLRSDHRSSVNSFT